MRCRGRSYRIKSRGDQGHVRPNPGATRLPVAETGRNVGTNSGSAPNGCYIGNDFRTAYVPGTTLTGLGQAVGLIELDGYNASDITYYENLAGRSPITLTNVLLDGATGAPLNLDEDIEVALDIEMIVAMAPGASKIVIYEAVQDTPAQWHDMLNRMATDDICKQLSCSWYIPGGTKDTTADSIFQELGAQGQSFFNASGDSCAEVGLVPFAGDTPYVTQVGGTTLTTSGVGGAYLSETVWNWGNNEGSSGGVSTQYSIPTWQQGISMTANLGSTTMRNNPDVAMTADGIYVRCDGGDYNVGGTSCAAPLWAAFTALINQQAVASGHGTMGFINPAIYALCKGSGYGAAFHDITTGNNYSTSSPSKFPAVTGYDLCTGWGSPTGMALINALAPPGPVITTSSPLPAGQVATAYSQSLTASGGTAPYTWSITSGALPAGLVLSGALISGTPTTAGTTSFTVQVKDSVGLASTQGFSLSIYAQGTPTIVTSSPLLSGIVGVPYTQTMTASGGVLPYTWLIISGTCRPG